MLEISRDEAMKVHRGIALCGVCPFFPLDCTALGPGNYCSDDDRDIVFIPLSDYVAWKLGANK